MGYRISQNETNISPFNVALFQGSVYLVSPNFHVAVNSMQVLNNVEVAIAGINRLKVFLSDLGNSHFLEKE